MAKRTILRASWVVVFLILAVVLTKVSSVWAGDIPMIDAHSQADINTELSDIVPLMNKAGVSRTLLASRHGLSWREIIALAERHPGRITPSVRTKGGDYSENKSKYYKRLRKQLESGAFGAMAELLIYHAEKGDKAPEVYVTFGSPQVKTAVDEAIERGWPVIAHIEFADIGSGGGGVPGRAALMVNLKQFLSRHKSHPVALIHMGQLEAKDARALIEAHGNIHFLTSHANPLVIESSRQPWINMFHHDRQRLADEWRTLVINPPSRFILAFDNVWPEHWSDYYLEQAKLWQNALSKLPPKVAHAIAHKNAERLWKLPAVSIP